MQGFFSGGWKKWGSHPSENWPPYNKSQFNVVLVNGERCPHIENLAEKTLTQNTDYMRSQFQIASLGLSTSKRNILLKSCHCESPTHSFKYLARPNIGNNRIIAAVNFTTILHWSKYYFMELPRSLRGMGQSEIIIAKKNNIDMYGSINLHIHCCIAVLSPTSCERCQSKSWANDSW